MAPDSNVRRQLQTRLDSAHAIETIQKEVDMLSKAYRLDLAKLKMLKKSDLLGTWATFARRLYVHLVL